MVVSKNSKILVLIVMVLLSFAFTQGSAIAQNAHFIAKIDWLDEENHWDGSVTMTLTIRDENEDIVQVAQMSLASVIGQYSYWDKWLILDDDAETWEVLVYPASMFEVNFLEDEDQPHDPGTNFLDTPFVFDD